MNKKLQKKYLKMQVKSKAKNTYCEKCNVGNPKIVRIENTWCLLCRRCGDIIYSQDKRVELGKTNDLNNEVYEEANAQTVVEEETKKKGWWPF